MYKKGDVLQARVTSFKPYGAFCEIGSTIGLIHISEFSDFFVKNIKDFVKLGDIIDVEVLDFNEDKSQLRLSYKSIRPKLLKNQSRPIKETEKGFGSLKREQVKHEKIMKEESTENK